MKADLNLIEEFKEICQELDWKFTGQRFAVYGLMRGNGDHPTADMVRNGLLGQYPAISRDSVFRIMNDFSEAGIFRRMNAAEPARFDADPSSHHHFFCRGCGAVIDFRIEVTLSFPEIPGIAEEIEIHANGLCRNCSDCHKGS